MRRRKNNLERKVGKSGEAAAALWDFSAGRDFSALLIFAPSRDYSGELSDPIFHIIGAIDP
jgi:hypothetical protein